MAKKTMFLEEYTIKGSHADKVNKLTEKFDSKSGARVFSSVVELFCFAALLGCIKNRKTKPEKDNTRTKKIFADAFHSHINQLSVAFKFVMLTSDIESPDSEDRLRKAFRNPETDENYSLFEEFALGGIDELYETFILDSNTTYNDYLTSLNKLISSVSTEDETSDTELTNDIFF